jgi:hypothetical protein
MILKAQSDSSYLNEANARSRVGAHMYLGNDTSKKAELFNGPIHTVSTVEKNVLSSAAEAEVCGTYHAMKEGLPIRTLLEEMGHPQPATPIQLDNATATGFANMDIKQRKSRAMDMRFYWVQDRVQQGQYKVYWAPAALNLADYFTKHHAPQHHRNMRHHFLHTENEHMANYIQYIGTFPT